MFDTKKQILNALNMKKLILILFVISTSIVFAQEGKEDSISTEDVPRKITTVDGEVLIKTTDRYKIYPTRNTYNFIKLDTRNGYITAIQWNIEDDKRFEWLISYDDLVPDHEDKINGRFEIYPTDNIYNFLLLDKINGNTWQVQWSFEPKENLVIRIWKK